MDKRLRRRFSKEFKAETVALIRQSGKSIAEICRDMGPRAVCTAGWPKPRSMLGSATA
jgi:transposase-like protein